MRRSYPVFAALVTGVMLAACSGEPTLDTRTFPLQYLEPSTARGLIEPYVYGDRPDHPGMLSFTSSTMTVRETTDNLDRIARVLAEYDVPTPLVRLVFQIIEADGDATADPRIAAVETELRKLFRYEGYRLVAEAVVSGTAQSQVQQEVGGGARGDSYSIIVEIAEVRTIGDSGFVSMHVELLRHGGGLSARINARIGQTVVLGNAQLGMEGGTTILTVRPEFITQ